MLNEMFKWIFFWLIFVIFFVNFWIYYFFIHKFQVLKQIPFLTDKYQTKDLEINNKTNFYYFTWQSFDECYKDLFDTDSLDKNSKILYVSNESMSDDFNKKIWAWNYLDMSWVLNDIDLYTELVNKTYLKCY